MPMQRWGHDPSLASQHVNAANWKGRVNPKKDRGIVAVHSWMFFSWIILKSDWTGSFIILVRCSNLLRHVKCSYAALLGPLSCSLWKWSIVQFCLRNQDILSNIQEVVSQLHFVTNSTSLITFFGNCSPDFLVCGRWIHILGQLQVHLGVTRKIFWT